MDLGENWESATYMEKAAFLKRNIFGLDRIGMSQF